MLIFLFIGACLYAFYVQHPGLPLPAKLDKIFPHFIEQTMPPLMRGLMLAAIVLASIDSPLEFPDFIICHGHLSSGAG